MKNIIVTPEMLETHLKTLDHAYDVAKKLYSKLINDADFDNDWATIREICDTSLATLEAIDKARFETQTQIIMTLRDETEWKKTSTGWVAEEDLEDYNEYNYNRDVDSYADDADALCSVFGGEE
jgi:hypothetical protein